MAISRRRNDVEKSKNGESFYRIRDEVDYIFLRLGGERLNSKREWDNMVRIRGGYYKSEDQAPLFSNSRQVRWPGVERKPS